MGSDPSVRSLMFPVRPIPSCDSPFFPQLFVCDTTPTCHSNITFFFGIINSLLYQNKNPVLQLRGLQQFCVSLNNFIGDCYNLTTNYRKRVPLGILFRISQCQRWSIFCLLWRRKREEEGRDVYATLLQSDTVYPYGLTKADTDFVRKKPKDYPTTRWSTWLERKLVFRWHWSKRQPLEQWHNTTLHCLSRIRPTDNRMSCSCWEILYIIRMYLSQKVARTARVMSRTARDTDVTWKKWFSPLFPPFPPVLNKNLFQTN